MCSCSVNLKPYTEHNTKVKYHHIYLCYKTRGLLKWRKNSIAILWCDLQYYDV